MYWFRYIIFFCVLACNFFFSSCKKDNFLSKGNLSFSTDTLVFDTVFTTIGSTTKKFKIYNKEQKTVEIEEIELMGGDQSPFRINVDGVQGRFLNKLKIEAKDSLFAFVEVTLQVNNQILPLIIEDSIRFRTNGKDQYIKLAVWGQDAYFHYKDLNQGVWPNDKPHVIYGYAAVDSAKTLDIQAGTKIHLHKNALLYVYKGTLNINGDHNNEVIIQGDRLEAFYSDVKGQYYGIYFQEARPSKINYAIIKNGTAGIHMYSRDNTFSGYTLELTNTKIFNHARYGVFLYSGTKLKAENCVVSKNGTHALLVLEGSDFFVNHCNLLGYGSDEATPAVGISNYFNNAQNSIINLGSINEGRIYNSVIYGLQSSEIAFDTLVQSGVTLNFDIQNCLIKRQTPATENYYSNVFWNINPNFTNTESNDFSFNLNSILNGNANPAFTALLPPPFYDIKKQIRNASIPDIGAYEVN